MLTHVHAQKRRRLRPRDQCSLCWALWPAWPTKVRAVRPCCPAHPFARARAHAHTHTHTHTHAHRRPAVVGDDAHQAPPVLRQARGPALGQATWHHLCFSRSCLYCTQNVVLTAHGVLSLLHICVHAITTPNKILIGIFTHANFYAHTSWCAHTHAHTSCTHPRASTETYTHTHTQGG